MDIELDREVEIASIIELLHQYWYMHPEQRLGQLFEELYPRTFVNHYCMCHVPDSIWKELLNNAIDDEAQP